MLAENDRDQNHKVWVQKIMQLILIPKNRVLLYLIKTIGYFWNIFKFDSAYA